MQNAGEILLLTGYRAKHLLITLNSAEPLGAASRCHPPTTHRRGNAGGCPGLEGRVSAASLLGPFLLPVCMHTGVEKPL